MCGDLNLCPHDIGKIHIHLFSSLIFLHHVNNLLTRGTILILTGKFCVFYALRLILIFNMNFIIKYKLYNQEILILKNMFTGFYQ